MSLSLSNSEEEDRIANAKLAPPAFPSLPVETWHQIVTSLDTEHDLGTLALICRVCKLFASIARPAVFKRVRRLNRRAKHSLLGSNGILLGSLVKQAEIEVSLVMVMLSREEEQWQPAELRLARKNAELELQKSFMLLDLCPNIEELSFEFDFEDYDIEHDGSERNGGYLNGEHADGLLPAVAAADLLELPCLDVLRVLRLASGRSTGYLDSPGDGFNVRAFGDLIAAARQLEVVALVDFYHPNLFTQLQHRLAEDPSLVRLKRLRYTLEKDRDDFSGVYEATEDFLGDLSLLPCVSQLRLEIPDDWLSALGPGPDNNTIFEHITSLALKIEGTITSENIKDLANFFPALQILHLDMHVGDRPIESVAVSTIFPRVHTLSIHYDLLGRIGETLKWLGSETPSEGDSPWALYEFASFPLLRHSHLILDTYSQPFTVQMAALLKAAQKGSEVLPSNVEVEIILQSRNPCSLSPECVKKLLRDATGWRNCA